MIDFDDIDDWAPKLAAALCDHVPESVEQSLLAAQPKYIEDAQDQLFRLTSRDALIDRTLAWIRESTIVGYHGSRLTNIEIASIRSGGLVPLEAKARRNRLARALSPHPRWPEVGSRLDAAIEKHGKGTAAGRREGQVHFTLSRAGLTTGFNHYLTHGSEFDQHVAHSLFGKEGTALLARDGMPTLVKVGIAGPFALEAAHPHFTVEDTRRMGNTPNLVDEFLKAWGYRLAHPGFQSASLKIDCGMRFSSIVPAEWIVEIEIVG